MYFTTYDGISAHLQLIIYLITILLALQITSFRWRDTCNYPSDSCSLYLIDPISDLQSAVKLILPIGIHPIMP